MNHRCVLGTDGASFYIHHPTDVGDPNNAFFNTWPGLRKPFADGLLVTFCTGGDGGFAFRITDGELNAEERSHEVCQCSFRYVVRHKLVHIDGGYGDPRQGFQFKMPNGNYRVTVHALHREEPHGRKPSKNAVVDYVVRWEPIKSLDEVEPPAGYPWLVGLPGDSLRLDTTIPEPTEDVLELEGDEALGSEVPVLLVPGKVIFPKEAVQIQTTGKWLKEIDRKQFVVVEAKSVPRLGTIARYSGGWGDERTDIWEAFFEGERLVRVTVVRKKKGELVASIEPINRPKKKATPTAVRKLIAEYQRVGQQYPPSIPNANAKSMPETELAYLAHQVECLSLMKTSTGVFLTILRNEKLPLDRAFVRELFTLSDADRVANLRAALAKLR